MRVARIRVNQVLPSLDVRQVFVCRVDTSGLDAGELDALAHGIARRWMADNPGVPVQSVIDWPSARDLGDQYTWRRAADQLPNRLVASSLGDDDN